MVADPYSSYGNMTYTATASTDTSCDYYYSDGDLTSNLPWGSTTVNTPTVTWAGSALDFTAAPVGSETVAVDHYTISTANYDVYYDRYGGHHRVWSEDGTTVDQEAISRDINRRIAEQLLPRTTERDAISRGIGDGRTATEIRMRQAQHEAELRAFQADFHVQAGQLAVEEERIYKEVREKAEKKAVKLLGRIIGEEDLAVYEKTGRLFIKGKNGDYVARKGQTLQKIEGNKVTDLCVHIAHRFNCPPTDTVIGLKFLLEDDDKKIVRLANHVRDNTVDEIPLAACM